MKAENAFMTQFTQALPDAQISVEASVAEQDIVASRWSITGTQRGTFQGVPATLRLVTFTGIDFSRVVDGKGSRTLGAV
jgi:predicted ester cyclase